ncbi:MAG: hypothetical protein V4805_05755 [Pseudomonadota bacterium]
MIIKILAVLLLFVSGYLGWWAVSNASFLWLLLPFILLVVAGGLFLNWHWVKFLWNVLALSISLWWLISTIRITISGWPYEDVLSSVISLVPGVLLILILAGSSLVIANHFRSKKDAG